MTRSIPATLLATALLSAVPVAHAQLRAETTIGNFTWHVIDLAPADGQAAGYMPAAAGPYRQVRTEIWSLAPPANLSDIQTTVDDARPLDSSLAFGTALASGHSDPGFDAARASAEADASLGSGSFATTNFSGGFDFTLLPHTRLVITGRAGWSDVRLDGSDDTATVATSHVLVGSVSGQEPPFPVSFQLTRTTGPGLADTAGHEDFTLVYLNDTDTAITTDFYVSINANVTAVPEPSRFMLLLGGLAGIAAWTKRHKRAVS